MEKTCFIIMPIATPDDRVPHFNNDTNHFSHVLEHFFIPSIKEAKYTPISPINIGSELIHAEIIKNLVTSDLVLVDMSILNANVFFEWGIRSALNKPVTVVVDDLTSNNIPFDVGSINYHEYKSDLAPWHLKDEITNLSKHIKDSDDKSKGSNSLWRHFGLKVTAELPEKLTGSDAELERIRIELQGIRNLVTLLNRSEVAVTFDKIIGSRQRLAITSFRKVARSIMLGKGYVIADKIKIFTSTDGSLKVSYPDDLSDDVLNELIEAANVFELNATFVPVSKVTYDK